MDESPRSARRAGVLVAISALALAFLCACRPNGVTTAKAPVAHLPEDPTLGICAAAPAPASGTPESSLAAAAAAVGRGCYQEAIQRIDELALGFNKLDTRTRGRLTFAVGQTQVAIFEAGYDSHGTSVLGPDRMHAAPLLAANMFPSAIEIMTAIAYLLEAGDLPSDVIVDGQVIDVLTRSAFPSCVDAKFDPIRKEARESLVWSILGFMRSAYTIQDLDELTEPGLVLALARTCSAACSYVEAAEFAGRAAAAFRSRKDVTRAQIAELFAIETMAFPGGRATELAVNLSEMDTATAEAADLLAAAEGMGPRFAAGTALERALTTWQAGQKTMTPAVRARLLWLRAAGALALRARPAEALEFAARLAEVSIEAKRADLLDASRVIEALAFADLGRWQDVERRLRLLDASFTARAAVGPRIALARQLNKRSRILARLGRREDVLRLYEAGSVVAVRAGLSEAFLYRSTRMELLIGLGRLEEALVEVETHLAEYRRIEAHLPVLQRDQFGIAIQNNHFTLLGALGRYDDITHMSEASPGFELDLAIHQGDIKAIRSRFAASGAGPETAESATIMLLAGFCSPYLDLARPSLDVAFDMLHMNPGSLRQMDPSTEAKHLGQYFVLSQVMLPMAFALGRCGAQLGDPSLAEHAVRIVRSAQDILGAVDPVIRAGIDAAAAESRKEYGQAARQYLDLGRDLRTQSGVSASGAVGRSQMTGGHFHRAAVAALRASPPFVAVALEALEDSRARALRSLRASKRPPPRDALKPLEALEEQLSQHHGQLRALSELLAEAADPASRAAIAARVTKLAGEVQRLEADRKQQVRLLADADPVAYRAAALAPPPTIPRLQSRLGPDEALVYFLVEPERAFALVLDATHARAVALPVHDTDGTAVLALNIVRLKYLLGLRTGSAVRGLVLDPGDPRTAAIDQEIEQLRGAVYRRLIRPLEAAIPAGRRVLIVPDETTADLAFSALGPADAPWIARNPIRILPGAYLLEPITPRKGSWTDVLVVGDPDFGATQARRPGPNQPSGVASTTFRPLPGTREEAVAVAKLYRTEPLLGGVASEQSVDQRIQKAGVIHIASHGMAELQDPDRSALVLAVPGKRTGADGILFGYEVERMNLSAELVVLSACETGRGQVRGTEGVLALDRAFILAGAKTVVSSQWLVPDGATAALMTAFHRGVLAGASADVALAKAMLSVQKTPGWEHPRFWSAFRVVGSGLR